MRPWGIGVVSRSKGGARGGGRWFPGGQAIWFSVDSGASPATGLFSDVLRGFRAFACARGERDMWIGMSRGSGNGLGLGREKGRGGDGEGDV